MLFCTAHPIPDPSRIAVSFFLCQFAMLSQEVDMPHGKDWACSPKQLWQEAAEKLDQIQISAVHVISSEI